MPAPATPDSSPPNNGHVSSQTRLENAGEPSANGKFSIDATDLAGPPSSNGTRPEDGVRKLSMSRTPCRPGLRTGRHRYRSMAPTGSRTARMARVFRARLFGTFRVETNAGEVEGWSIQKARELLAYLLAHGGSPVLRDTAAEALGLSGDNQRGHPLPNAAYYVRRTLTRAIPGS